MDTQQNKRRLALWLAVFVTAFLAVSWFYYEHVTGRYTITATDISQVHQTIEQVNEVIKNSQATTSNNQGEESLNLLLQPVKQQ